MPIIFPEVTGSLGSVTTLPATSVTTTTAVLNGVVTPTSPVLAYFEYGTTTAYGSQTTPVLIPAGASPVDFPASVFGLGGTLYHFRAVAVANVGTAYGADLEFSPSAGPVTPVSLSENFGIIDLSQYTCNQGSTNDAAMGRVPGVVQGWGLYTQRHIDVRTFNAAGSQIPENWATNGASMTVGPQAAYDHMNGLTVTPTGAGTTTLSSSAAPVDLTRLGQETTLMLALPSFPLAAISLIGSSLELSSNAFQTSVQLPFSASTNTLVNGNTHVSWPLADLVGLIDLTHVTDIRLVIDATAACQLTAMALRLVVPGWVAKDVDFDNWNDCLRQCVPLDGTLTELPVPNNQVLPYLWRAGPIPGAADPRPIDAAFSVVFNTGSQTAINSFQLNLRNVNGTDASQLQLDNQIQIQLNGPQPTLSTSALLGRTVGDLETQRVGQLDSESMEQMDAIAADVDQSWLSFQVGWGTLPYVRITRSDTQGDYEWIGSNLTFADGSHVFANNTYYMMQVTLTDTTARLQIYQMSQGTFAVGSLWFDSFEIQDSYRLIRRAGRVGWKATLQDGDALIRSIQPESTMFAEYRSVPMNSNTPVKGARLYANFAPTLQLWQDWAPTSGTGGVAPTVTTDTRRSISGQSTRVDITQPAASGQGLLSNTLAPSNDLVGGVTDWAATTIDLSLWFPGPALAAGAGLQAYLLSKDGNHVALSMSRITPNQWQAIRINIPPGLQSGLYQFGLTYQGTAAATFWVDEVAIIERTLIWSARPSPNDVWVDFEDAVNSDSAGVMFSTTPGSALQVRAQALHQDCVIIGSPKIVPLYAELGNLVWPENAVADPYTISAASPITVAPGSPTHSTVTTFTSNVTTTPANGLINWFWAFGDGAAADGPVTQHTYASAGTYTVSLTVTDAWGGRSSYLTSVAVT